MQGVSGTSPNMIGRRTEVNQSLTWICDAYKKTAFKTVFIYVAFFPF